MFQKTTLSCIEDLKNLGSLIALIAKAAPDTTLANDIES
ncbi:helix-turn-helix domain-containing protein, partial [Escherichia coli]